MHSLIIPKTDRKRNPILVLVFLVSRTCHSNYYKTDEIHFGSCEAQWTETGIWISSESIDCFRWNCAQWLRSFCSSLCPPELLSVDSLFTIIVAKQFECVPVCVRPCAMIWSEHLPHYHQSTVDRRAVCIRNFGHLNRLFHIFRQQLNEKRKRIQHDDFEHRRKRSIGNNSRGNGSAQNSEINSKIAGNKKTWTRLSTIVREIFKRQKYRTILRTARDEQQYQSHLFQW